jgi:hypothetical protein
MAALDLFSSCSLFYLSHADCEATRFGTAGTGMTDFGETPMAAAEIAAMLF